MSRYAYQMLLLEVMEWLLWLKHNIVQNASIKQANNKL